MSVLLETSKGDIVIDLYVDQCPLASKNFLKLCKIKYYNNCLFHTVVRNFLVQTGDPSGSGKGGDSINGIMYGAQARFFADEIFPTLRHKKKGLVSMAGGGKDMNASQFFITTGTDLDSLDEKHTIFGEVTEGFDELEAINSAFVDGNNRPLQNIRIRHTIILEDPFPDPSQLADHIPEKSPEPEFASEVNRLEEDWVPKQDTRDAAVVEAEARKYEAQKRAEVLEMVGDLPSADAAPPPNMIFVCKLNPVTTDEDLEIIFSRFGKVTSCDIIRDYKTGDSLCYAFIGFETDKAAETAFFKMENCLIDDRRIHVDFSQSMHHLWRQFRAFGAAGSAALKEEAENLRPAKKQRVEDKIELKSHRGLYAGPSSGQKRGYGMVYDDDDEAGVGELQDREGSQRYSRVREKESLRQRNHNGIDDSRDQTKQSDRYNKDGNSHSERHGRHKNDRNESSRQGRENEDSHLQSDRKSDRHSDHHERHRSRADSRDRKGKRHSKDSSTIDLSIRVRSNHHDKERKAKRKDREK